MTATVEAHLWCRCRSRSRSRRWCSCGCSFLDATSSSITPNCHQLSVVIGQGIARPRPTRPGPGRAKSSPDLGWSRAATFTTNMERGTWYVILSHAFPANAEHEDADGDDHEVHYDRSDDRCDDSMTMTMTMTRCCCCCTFCHNFHVGKCCRCCCCCCCI